MSPFSLNLYFKEILNLDDLREIKSEIRDLDNRVTTNEQDIAVMKERESNMDDLIKRNISAYEKLDHTMQEFGGTMIKVTTALDNMNTKVEDVQSKIDNVQEEVVQLKEERNINIIEWIRDNWYTIILGGGLIYEVIKDFM